MKDPNKPSVEVCITPRNYPLYKEVADIVVVIDVLRATSAICTAFDHGLKKLIPVAELDEARAYQGKPDHIVAAERNGEIVEGFDKGNSPYGFMDGVEGKTVVLSTTNGTKTIKAADDAGTIVIGSLLNLQVLTDWLIRQDRDVLLLCSGWKDKLNLEDTICAGAFAHNLLQTGRFQSMEDSTIMAKYLFLSAKDNYFGFLRSSSHRRRLQRLNLNEDIKYCLTPNQSESIPVMEGDALVPMSAEVFSS
jgi:2-phosphosulfolactate phosphatase